MVNLRAAVRPLIQQPAFTTVAVLTIAIGIGANAALFSVYDQLVLNPVTAPDPDSLVAISSRNTLLNRNVPNVSWPRYREIKEKARTFASVGFSAASPRATGRSRCGRRSAPAAPRSRDSSWLRA